MKKILAIIFSLLPLVGYADVTIRPGHPRIFFNQDTWPELVARAEGVAKPYLDRLVAQCDAMTDNPVCKGTGPLTRKAGKQADGSYISITGTSVPGIREFGEEAAKCALVWRFTGQDKYLEKARRMLKASVDGYAEATKNRRPVNWYSTGRINALCAYDWIYDGLSDSQRREIIVPLIEHVRLVQPEAGLNIPRQPPGSKKTGFYGMDSLLWYAGLAAAGDGYCDSLANDMLQRGYKQFIEVVENRNATAGDDGALISSATGYACGVYPYAHFNFFSSLASSTGKDITAEYPKMALFPYWVWWTWIRDARMSDSASVSGGADEFHCENAMSLTGRMFEHLSNYIWYFRGSNPEAAAFTSALREWLPNKEFSSPFPATPFLIDSDATVEKKYSDGIANPSLKARHFETLGQIIMRSAWEPGAPYCTFTAGASITQHKHYDENNFTIFKYDHLALDSGCRAKQNDLNLVYYYAQSVAHNVVLIQQPGEKRPPYWGPRTEEPGANLCYGGQVNHKPAKVLAFETGDDYTYVASDATVCYGPKARECVRQFVFVYPDYFIVYDRVSSSDPSYEKDWLLHFKNEPVIEGNLLRADSDGGRLFCETLLPQNARIDLVGGPGKEFWVRDRNFDINPKVMEAYREKALKNGRGPYYGSWRIELKPSEETSDVQFLNVLTATSSDNSHPVKVKRLRDSGRDGVALTVGRKKYTFWFNRSGEVGGEVITGKTARPLSDKVQPQSGILL